jgi:hypothetical protein
MTLPQTVEDSLSSHDTTISGPQNLNYSDVARVKRHRQAVEKSLPPQDAAIGDTHNPRLFEVSPTWKKAMNGFLHR